MLRPRNGPFFKLNQEAIQRIESLVARRDSLWVSYAQLKQTTNKARFRDQFLSKVAINLRANVIIMAIGKQGVLLAKDKNFSPVHTSYQRVLPDINGVKDLAASFSDLLRLGNQAVYTLPWRQIGQVIEVNK